MRRRTRRRIPLVVEVPQPSEERLAPLLRGCEVVHFPASERELVDAVARALAASRRPGHAPSGTSA